MYGKLACAMISYCVARKMLSFSGEGGREGGDIVFERYCGGRAPHPGASTNRLVSFGILVAGIEVLGCLVFNGIGYYYAARNS